MEWVENCTIAHLVDLGAVLITKLWMIITTLPLCMKESGWFDYHAMVRPGQVLVRPGTSPPWFSVGK